MARGLGRRSIAATLLALAAGSGGAVPPPLPQIGADCERPVYASDQRVCADPALRALDERVRDAWLAILAAGTAPGASAWFEPQDAWFLRRSRCAFSERHAACLQAAYAERNALLQGWIAAAGVSPGGGRRHSTAPMPHAPRTAKERPPMRETWQLPAALLTCVGWTLARLFGLRWPRDARK